MASAMRSQLREWIICLDIFELFLATSKIWVAKSTKHAERPIDRFFFVDDAAANVSFSTKERCDCGLFEFLNVFKS